MLNIPHAWLRLADGAELARNWRSRDPKRFEMSDT
jgi:hypothetical protein